MSKKHWLKAKIVRTQKNFADSHLEKFSDSYGQQVAQYSMDEKKIILNLEENVQEFSLFHGNVQ